MQPRDNLQYVPDRALRQVSHLGTRIGQDFLARAVIELLRDLQGFGSRPAEPGAAKFLQRRQIVKPGRALPLVLDPYAERTLEVPRRGYDLFCVLALEDAVFRCVPHPERAPFDMGRGHDFEVRNRHEVADFKFAFARDRQGRCLDPAHTDHAPRAPAKRDGRGAGQRQVVYLIGLPARHGGGVEAGIIAVGPGAAERLANGLRVLRGEQHPQNLATIAAMLEDLLADELSLTVTIGGQPDACGGAQRPANGLQFHRFVAARGRFGAV